MHGRTNYLFIIRQLCQICDIQWQGLPQEFATITISMSPLAILRQNPLLVRSQCLLPLLFCLLLLLFCHRTPLGRQPGFTVIRQHPIHSREHASEDR